MSHALPVGHKTYIQYLKTDPAAPRREPARTHEVKGKMRHGEGTAFRLFGHHALVVGQWTGRAMTETERTEFEYQSQEGERLDPWGRLISPDEIDTVARQVFEEKVKTGWNPAGWHWRYYWEAAQHRLNNIGLLSVIAYNDVHWTPKRFLVGWLRFFYDRLKMRLFPVEVADPPTQLSEWRAMHTDDDDTDGLAL